MKKKTTWAASVVKKQLQTCCKHQAFSLETTGDDCNTSQGFGSPSRVIQISSPIRELQPSSLDNNNNNNHPVLQRRKSFNVLHGRSLLTGTPEPLTPFRKSVESAIPLCRSSSTFKSSQRLKSSPEEPLAPSPAPPRKVVLHKSGPLPVLQQLLRGTGGLVASPLYTVKKQLSGPLPGGRPQSGNPSPLPRISKVKFSPLAPPTTTQIVTECFQEPPPASSSSPEFAPHETVANLRGGDDDEVQCGVREEEKDVKIAAAVKIQAAYRGHQARRNLRRRSVSSSVSAPSISTQESRTDPQKQRRTPVPRVIHKGWNGSIRSAQDHQALLRSRQEAALKRERAMEYALSRQRWRSGKGAAKAGWMITDDRVPDKPGWVRNWLERATRMSNQNSQQNRVFNEINPQPESESLSMKSTVGMCTTDIGSVPEVQNLGWPLSLRQQHAAGLLQNQTIPEPPAPTPPQNFHCNEFSTSTGDSSEQSRHPHVHYRGHSDDRESVGSCEGPVSVLTKVPSPVVFTVHNGNKPRLQQQKATNSNSLKEAAKLRENQLHPQSQVSVALSDGNSADTTMASIQRPLWR